MSVAIHVAIAENGVIGREGALPWRLSTDLKRFKAETLGKPVIMGRRTYDAIGKPLPLRFNIVVTRDAGWHADGATAAASLDEAFRLAEARAHEGPAGGEIIVAGGGEIYRQALARADSLHVTHVLATIDGDTRFPPIDPDKWRVESAVDVPAGAHDTHPTRHVVYRRVRP